MEQLWGLIALEGFFQHCIDYRAVMTAIHGFRVNIVAPTEDTPQARQEFLNFGLRYPHIFRENFEFHRDSYS